MPKAILFYTEKTYSVLHFIVLLNKLWLLHNLTQGRHTGSVQTKSGDVSTSPSYLIMRKND